MSQSSEYFSPLSIPFAYLSTRWIDRHIKANSTCQLMVKYAYNTRFPHNITLCKTTEA